VSDLFLAQNFFNKILHNHSQLCLGTRIAWLISGQMHVSDSTRVNLFQTGKEQAGAATLERAPCQNDRAKEGCHGREQRIFQNDRGI
jgi:hypothetical protein